ncbi:MAG TPA: MFS transporter [Roseiflexaceae bacterium]|nr:MFS transporter [Roseiflexaceae bacterium]
MQFFARARALRLLRAAPAAPAAPDAALSPAAIRAGLRLSTIEGALANVHISVTTGAFLTGFGLLLGARDFELGLLGALPFVGQLFQFVGAYLEERLGDRRRLAVAGCLAGRGAWALIAALPFLAALGPAQLPLFLLLLTLSQAVMGMVGNVWTSWMSDLVPPRQRGSYFGVRNTVGSITAIVSTWLAGRALDHYQGIGDERTGYALIFGVAVACSLVAAVVLSRQPEPPLRRQERVRISALLSAPLRNRGFRRFTLAASGWAVVTGIAAPFFNAYGLQSLQLDFTTLALFGVVTSAVAMLTQPLIGRLQDRYGDKRILVASIIGTVLLPWGWVFSTPTFLLPVWLTSIFSGVFWPGITQGLMNLLMDRSAPEGRGAYVAAYGAVSGFGSFVSGVLGGLLATLLSSTVLHLGPLSLGHYAALFALSSLGRAAMAWVFAREL